MSLSELLRLPQMYMPRLKKLARKVGGEELSTEEAGIRAMGAVGRMRIDREGISIKGPFGTVAFDSNDFQTCVDTILKALECLPILKGKELLVKKGNRIVKIKFGWLTEWLPKISPSGEWEESDPSLPMIEIGSVVEQDGFRQTLQAFGREGDFADGFSGPGIRIHRLEELAGWAGNWEEFSRMMDILVAAVALTTQKNINRVSQTAPKILDQALDRCGV